MPRWTLWKRLHTTGSATKVSTGGSGRNIKWTTLTATDRTTGRASSPPPPIIGWSDRGSIRSGKSTKSCPLQIEDSASTSTHSVHRCSDLAPPWTPPAPPASNSPDTTTHQEDNVGCDTSAGCGAGAVHHGDDESLWVPDSDGELDTLSSAESDGRRTNDFTLDHVASSSDDEDLMENVRQAVANDNNNNHTGGADSPEVPAHASAPKATWTITSRRLTPLERPTRTPPLPPMSIMDVLASSAQATTVPAGLATEPPVTSAWHSLAQETSTDQVIEEEEEEPSPPQCRRRLESVHNVARRWRLDAADAAEIMANVDAANAQTPGW